MKQIHRLNAPATVANLVCGFDVLGMCLNEPYDIMEVKLLDEREVIVFAVPMDMICQQILKKIQRSTIVGNAGRNE